MPYKKRRHSSRNASVPLMESIEHEEFHDKTNRKGPEECVNKDVQNEGDGMKDVDTYSNDGSDISEASTVIFTSPRNDSNFSAHSEASAMSNAITVEHESVSTVSKESNHMLEVYVDNFIASLSATSGGQNCESVPQDVTVNGCNNLLEEEIGEAPEQNPSPLSDDLIPAIAMLQDFVSKFSAPGVPKALPSNIVINDKFAVNLISQMNNFSDNLKLAQNYIDAHQEEDALNTLATTSVGLRQSAFSVNLIIDKLLSHC